MDNHRSIRGFGAVPRKIMTAERISWQAKLLYSYLAAYAGADRSTFVGAKRILSELGWSKRTLSKHRAELVAAGLVACKARMSRGGRKTVYALPSLGPAESGYGLIQKSILANSLPPAAKCLYAYLVSYAGADGSTSVSSTTAMRQLGWSKPTWLKHRAELVAAGLVELSEGIGNGGYRAVYTLPCAVRCIKGSGRAKGKETDPCHKRENPQVGTAKRGITAGQAKGKETDPCLLSQQQAYNNIHPLPPAGPKGPAQGQDGRKRMERQDDALSRLKAMSVNGNSLYRADAPFRALVAEGHDPSEVVLAWERRQAALKAQGRADRYFPALPKWLDGTASGCSARADVAALREETARRAAAAARAAREREQATEEEARAKALERDEAYRDAHAEVSRLGAAMMRAAIFGSPDDGLRSAFDAALAEGERAKASALAAAGVAA